VQPDGKSDDDDDDAVAVPPDEDPTFYTDCDSRAPAFLPRTALDNF